MSYISTKIFQASYLFFLLKVADLLDTVFFILRKKGNQVTFLHIYHHAGMVTAGYVYLKLYSGGGYATVLGKTLVSKFYVFVWFLCPRTYESSPKHKTKCYSHD